MAQPWNSSTPYAGGAVVSYNGLEYVRSNFPVGATSGTPPNEEMGVDTYGNAVRTWTLILTPTRVQKYVMYYFRLTYPEDGAFDYSGMQFLASNAYDEPPDQYTNGTTKEYDQAKTNPAPQPNSPVCPSDKCGVAMQAGNSVGEPYIELYYQEGAGGRTYYHYVIFNHPLYFRRSISFKSKIRVTTTDKNPPADPVITYTYINTTYGPDDRNFAFQVDPDYYVPANSAFTVIVPPDVNTPDQDIVYQFLETQMLEIAPND